MLINAAPRSYTSNIVADADLNLEGYNVTANALYSKDNYLLTMLNYGEAFPTDVKEGDKLFAWGEDSTKSYIYTYKQGAWDAGVKPQHMADYYIADENRMVKFYRLKPSSSRVTISQLVPVGGGSSTIVQSRGLGLVLSPDVYLLGKMGLGCCFDGPADSSNSFVIYGLGVHFTDSTSTVVRSDNLISPGDGVKIVGGDTCLFEVSFPSKVNSFNVYFGVTNATSSWGVMSFATYALDV